jgi:hypothetical protein
LTGLSNISWLIASVIDREGVEAKWLFLDSVFGIENCFFERSPFVVLLVAFAYKASLLTLYARWFGLVTFQSLLLASHASCWRMC